MAATSPGRRTAARAGGRPALGQLNQSVEKAIAILSAFGPQHPHLGAAELARQLGLSRSAVSRLLASLECGGYVTQDPRTGRFRLGIRALELGYRCFQTNELVIASAPYLTNVAQQLEVHAHLYGLLDGQLFRYLTVPYPTGVSVLGAFLFPGRAHATAAGKVLLAHLTRAQLTDTIGRWGLPAVTHRTLTDPVRLRTHLAEVRRGGYALDDEESAVGLRCVAVPVHDASGGVTAALSVSARSSRLPDERLLHVRDQLLEAAAHVSAALGCYVPLPIGEAAPGATGGASSGAREETPSEGR